MPVRESWNRKYQAVGGRGWGGNFNVNGMLSALRHDRVNMSGPLCPYPQVAVYKGTGDTDLASNFVCKPQ
jgi:hypothetical protein